MKIFLPITILPFLLISLAACDNDHGNFSFTCNGKRYELVKDKKTWPDAAKYAAARGGYLAAINTKEEQDVIYKNIINDGGIAPDYTSVKDGGDIAYVWIGGTDAGHEGNWLWDGANKGDGKNFWNGEGAHGKGNGAVADSAYNNWGGTYTGKPNEPDNSKGKQNAAAVGLADWPKGTGALGHAGEWNDIDENNKLYFVVAFDK